MDHVVDYGNAKQKTCNKVNKIKECYFNVMTFLTYIYFVCRYDEI